MLLFEESFERVVLVLNRLSKPVPVDTECNDAPLDPDPDSEVVVAVFVENKGEGGESDDEGRAEIPVPVPSNCCDFVARMFPKPPRPDDGNCTSKLRYQFSDR